MNYLSHLYLSQRTPNSMAGNLMGDFKPDSELRAALPEGILLGIENHRLVDRVTDRFEPVKRLRTVFSDRRRRYAGIITDVAFDYFLIKHWEDLDDGDFPAFTKQCYHGLEQTREWMPPRMALVTRKMQEHDWLSAYATLDGIGITLDQVGKRMRFANQLAGSVEEVHANYTQIEAVFLDLIEHLQAQIASAAIEHNSA